MVNAQSSTATSRAQVVVAHLALDTAGIHAISAGADAFLENLLEYRLMEGRPVLRGE